jgi:LacI family transcriptional regulator
MLFFRMKKKKITISDVARDMRVSVTTVSFVLNGKAEGRISPSVIRRITAYADKIGYRPNPKVKRGPLSKKKLYGVLIDDISNVFQGRLVSELEQCLRSLDGHVLVMSANGDDVYARQMIAVLMQMDLSGYFSMPFVGLENLLDGENKANKPLVILDVGLVGAQQISVQPNYGAILKGALIDYAEASLSARIGLVIDPANAHRATSFLNGYMQAMDELNSDVLVKKIQQGAHHDAIRVQINDFLLDNRLDAVVFSTNRLANLALPIVSKENIYLKCVVSTADTLSFEVDGIDHVTLPLDVRSLADEIAKGLSGK